MANWTCPHCNHTFELILNLNKPTIVQGCCGIKTRVTAVSKFDFITELICKSDKDHDWTEIKDENITVCSKCHKIKQ
jgi:hypothetical protein